MSRQAGNCAFRMCSMTALQCFGKLSKNKNYYKSPGACFVFWLFQMVNRLQ